MSTSQGSNPRSRHLFRAVALAGALLLGALGVASPAHAQEMADTMVIEGTVAADGTLSVTQTLTFADAAPDELTQRLATIRPALEYTQLEYEITDVTASAGGTDLSPEVSTDGDYLVISLDTSEVGDEPIEMNYKVTGAAVALPEVPGQPAMTEVSWRVLQGLSVGATKVSGVFPLPNGASITDVDCQAGPPAAPVSCSTFAAGTFEAPYPEFTDGPRGPGEVVIMTFTVPSTGVAPNQVVTEQWTLDRAFSTDPGPLLAALAALVIGGLVLVWLLRSRGDAVAGQPTLVGSFEPIAAGEEQFKLAVPIHPGEVGTLMDERVDPVDITATIIDLAQRGHLTIVELPLAGPHAPHDWTFERHQGPEDLHDYERTLLDAIAPVDGPAATVSRIGDAVTEAVDTVQEQIYAEVVREGWFAARPDDVRAQWGRIGTGAVIVALVALGLLVAFTRLGLLGLVLVGLAVALVWVGQQLPRRTKAGSSVLRGLQVLALNLQTRPTNHLPKANTYGEISRVLPYAIVLGCAARWLQAMVDADNDPGVPDPDDLGWYRAPNSWQLADLPGSLDAFITTIEGKLYGRG